MCGREVYGSRSGPERRGQLPGRSAPRAPSRPACTARTPPDVGPGVEQLLGRRDAHLRRKLLPIVEVDGEHAVAAVVVHGRVQARSRVAMASGPVLHVVGQISRISASTVAVSVARRAGRRRPASAAGDRAAGARWCVGGRRPGRAAVVRRRRLGRGRGGGVVGRGRSWSAAGWSAAAGPGAVAPAGMHSSSPTYSGVSAVALLAVSHSARWRRRTSGSGSSSRWR